MGWWFAAVVTAVAVFAWSWLWRRFRAAEATRQLAETEARRTLDQLADLRDERDEALRERRRAEDALEDALAERDALRDALAEGETTRRALTQERNVLRERLSSRPPPPSDPPPAGSRRSSTGTLIGLPAARDAGAAAEGSAEDPGSGATDAALEEELARTRARLEETERALCHLQNQTGRWEPITGDDLTAGMDPADVPPRRSTPGPAGVWGSGRPSSDPGDAGELETLRAELRWLRIELARAEDDKSALLDHVSGLEIDLGAAQDALDATRQELIDLQPPRESRFPSPSSPPEAVRRRRDTGVHAIASPSEPRPRPSAGGATPDDTGDEVGDVERDAIRERAFELWDRDGRPEGRDQEFWLRAEEELGVLATGEGRTGDGHRPG